MSSYGAECMHELAQMLQSPEFDNNELFRAGRLFAKEYPSGIAAVESSKGSCQQQQPSSSPPSEVTNASAKAPADAINFMRGIM